MVFSCCRRRSQAQHEDSASVFAVERQTDEQRCLHDQQEGVVALRLCRMGSSKEEGEELGSTGVIGISFPNGPALAALSIMLPLVPASEVAVAGAEASSSCSSCSSYSSSDRFGPACRLHTPTSFTGGRDPLPVHHLQQYCWVEEREATQSGAHYTKKGTYFSTYPHHTTQLRLALRQNIWPAGAPMWGRACHVHIFLTD